MSKRLAHMLGQLDKYQRGRYYTICAEADTRLKRDDYKALNVRQCEFICESLLTNRQITMRKIKEMGEPAEIAQGSHPDLFGSPADSS